MRHGRNLRALLKGAIVLSALILCAEGRADEKRAAPEQLAYERERLVERARQRSAGAAGGEQEVKEAVAAQRDVFERVAPEALSTLEWCLGRTQSTEAGVPEARGLVHEAAALYQWIVGAAEAASAPVLHYVNPADPQDRVPLGAMPADDPRLIAWEINVLVDEDGTVVGPRLSWLPQLLGPKGKAALVPIALTGPHELKLRTCRAWVDAREAQVAPRIQAFQAEQPSQGLVNDVTVSRKRERASAYAETLASLENRKADMIEALNGLVPRERELLDTFGALGFELEEARGRAKEFEDKKEEVPADVAETLSRLRIQEFALQQQERLLYLTVRRADARIGLYDQAIRQVKDEQQAAADAYNRFEVVLNRLTRLRQLDRLASAQRSLDRRHEEAHARAQAKDTPEAERPLWAAYDAALEALLVVNEATTDAVQTRRGLERLLSAEQATAAAPEAPKTMNGGAAANGNGSPADVAAKPDPLRRFRDPPPGRVNAGYVREAMRMLEHPAWDAELAAGQYAVLEGRIKDFERALKRLRAVPQLEARFQKARAGAEAALADALKLGLASANPPTWRARWRQRITRPQGEDLGPNVAAFEETVRRIKETGAVAENELLAFRAYRRALLDLEDRSFQIRVQSDLDGRGLEEAVSDVAATTRDAGRWLTFQGSDNLGTFVVRNGWKLLICLGALVASFLCVRYGRRALDRIVRHMASRVPALRVQPVTVRAEDAEARRSKAVLEAAAREAEKAALREVSKEEAAKAQRMGEGGYSE